MAFAGGLHGLLGQRSLSILRAAASATPAGRGRPHSQARKSAGKSPSAPLRPTVLCRSEASSCADHFKRSPATHCEWPTPERASSSERAAPPEASTPSTSGRSHQRCRSNTIHESNTSTGRDAFGYEETWDLPDDGYTPFPGNLPTGSGAEGLAQHDLLKSSRLLFGVQSSDDRWRCLSQVWVLLFGVGTRDTEGIYSLRAMSRETGVPQDTIIAFEDAEDAERYAGLLEATMEHVPHVSPINVQELLDFCQDSGYKCRLEPCGTLLLPPDYNIGMTDWERSLRLREGNFTVLEAEPETTAPDGLTPLAPAGAESEPLGPPQMHNNAGVGPPPADIEDWRARLERQWH